MNDKFLSVKEFLSQKKFKNLTNEEKREEKKSNKTSKLFVSIESGKFKGKKLRLPSLNTTRSTKSIVRACVFNVLRQNLRDKIFIEAFGGSALMAAEALSNDALKSYAIELDAKAYEIAFSNAKSLSENLEVLRGDTFEILPNLTAKLQQDFILYCDPPFEIREGFERIYERIFKLIESLNLKYCKMLIIEHHSNIEMPLEILNLSRVKFKKFGATSLSFYEKI